MIFRHNDFEFEVPDRWWTESKMPDFRPADGSYRYNPSPDDPITVVAINEIEPVRRSLSAGVFNDTDEATAEHRVKRLFDGFRTNAAIPPVKCIESTSGDYRYKLTEGVHRLYCSIAAGFTHIPTVEGFDPGPSTIKF